MLLGIVVGHLYFFLTMKYPQEFGGRSLISTPQFLYVTVLAPCTLIQCTVHWVTSFVTSSPVCVYSCSQLREFVVQ